jgi:ATP-dependent Lhr-like helicase
MFASRFRECAARALLLPRRRPDRRTPLWQQRQRSADLLSVASKYPSFPILLEATRECLNDVFDVPALREVLTDIRARRVRVVTVKTDRASPMAQSLLFGWIAVYMYEGDAPLAERRAAALALDRDLLRELLGAEELRELLDPGVLADLELELQGLADNRLARDADEAHDRLRTLGPLTVEELVARSVVDAPVEAWVATLEREHRAFRVADRLYPAEDAARVRDALGIAIPVGLPAAFTDPVDEPLLDLVARYARTHGPFLTRDAAERIGAPLARVQEILEALERDGRVVRGEFRPGGVEREWCDDDVLRQLRRRSLAALRHEVEPVEPEALARFLPAWHGVGSTRRGVDALVEVLGTLQGAALPASVIERDVLSARLAGYREADLDALCASGDLVWVGAGSLGTNDGRVRLVFRNEVGLHVPPADEPPSGPTHDAIRAHLAARGASFWTDLVGAVAAAELPYENEEVLAALWDLVWAGEVTNDTFAPVRSFATGGSRRRAARPARSRPRPGRLARSGPPSGVGRWSLVADLRVPEPAPTEVAHARALQALERHGVVTREAVLAEGAPGGFAGVYPVLKALEDRGEVRRGYFVAGLGGAQFALPGAVDRLRSARAGDPDAPPIVLAATDPAQPYGAALSWPATEGRPARQAGAYVVVVDGRPLVLVERGGRGLVLFEGWEDDPRWADSVTGLVKDGRLRSMTVSRIDGEPVREHPAAAVLRDAGFLEGYRGLVFRG